MNRVLIGLTIASLAAGAAYATEGRWHGGATVTRAEAQAKAAQMFDRLDANHDGKLDMADRDAHKAAIFDKIDTNHDGQISKAEFMAFKPMEMGEHGPGRAMGDHEMGDHRIGHGMGGGRMAMMMLRNADANHDGAVSRDEFIAAALSRFDQADTNHDGKVTPEERKTARAAMREHMMHGMGRYGEGDDMRTPPPAN